MRKAKLCALYAMSLAVAAVGFAGCATSEVDRTAGMSPNKLYAEAKDEQSAGAYDKAALLFEKLEGRAAGTPLAQQAQLEKAYSKYKASESAEALAVLERFMKLHPASPALDYAIYLKGIINFNDDLGLFASITRQDLSERDQRASKESFDAFKELTSRFPDSKYSPDARQRMVYIVNSLAQYEVHVARYYYRRGAYVAAINRAQVALAEYRAVPALEEALYIVFMSYDALGIPELRDDAKRVLIGTYPQTEYLSRGFKPDSNPWWKIW